MKKFAFKLLGCFGFIFVLVLTSCAQNNSPQYLQQRLTQSARLSQAEFTPIFSRDGVSYPPHELALLIFKDQHELELYAKEGEHWKYIKEFHVLAESGTMGPKLREGDHQVPEGVYHIIALNPQSHFDMSLQLDYPNEEDRHFAALDHRGDLGNDIFIHGDRKSVGCIAIGNRAIEEIYPLVAKVGADHVEVIVAPNDFRTQKPILSYAHPKWVPTLYQNIGQALHSFPVA